MKIRLPLMVQDPSTARLKSVKATEDFFAYGEDFYFDGPITERMAVIDFDLDSGDRIPGVKFIPREARKLPHFDVPEISGPGRVKDIKTSEFIQAAVLAMALKTLYLFEQNDKGEDSTDSNVIGRRLEWAFQSPQLLLVPRAGFGANAYYERLSHSIQFFCFYSRRNPGQLIHTCLSRDIVAHETTHAILDAIVPDLYDAITPQSLAIHEALADLAASLVSIESHTISGAVLAETKGDIRDTTAFSSIAEEFGQGRDPFGKAHHLRNLYDPQIGMADMDEEIPQPHDLSRVLSAALYQVLVRIYDELIWPFLGKEYSASGNALRVSSTILRQKVFGALDYLPPGDATFADLGRAIIAADRAIASDAQSVKIRRYFQEEFVRRGIVEGMDDLERGADVLDEALQVDINELIASDWVAYTFARDHAAMLRIPKGANFRVWPRLVTNRKYRSYTTGDANFIEARECIFKVSWTGLEKSTAGPFPPRRVSAGSTLVIDLKPAQPRLRSILTTDLGRRNAQARDRYLGLLYDRGILKLDDRSTIQDDFPGSFITAETRSGTMRVRGTARMLHIVG